MSENEIKDPKVREAIQNYRLIAAQCDEAVKKAREAQNQAWAKVKEALEHARILQQSPT